MKSKEYSEIIKKTFIDIGTKEVVSFATKNLPFLFLPIFNPISKYIINKVIVVLVEKTEVGLFFAYTYLRVDQQGRNFSDAAMNNHRVQLEGNEDEKKQAESDLISSFRTFAKFTS